jgi:hypothetical protein
MKKIFLIGLFFLVGVCCFAETYKLYGYQNGKYSVFIGEIEVRSNQIYENEYGSNSIFNEYGTYGSEYSSTSIWNQYGSWGSEYSSTSATNQYATNPPAIVDRNGSVVGYLTANKYFSSNTNFGKSLSHALRLQ